ncbi:MAG TPA: glycosyltransferase family 2 protein [Thermoanaerobaculia bacterium]|nr:glycosyltransferase family 2 protein [Thermoanaerobaculia bacterium]
MPTTPPSADAVLAPLGAPVPGEPAAPRVSLVVPAYNEEKSLPDLAREIREALLAAGLAYELILVDDGSTDGTLSAMLDLARRDPAVRVLRQRPNLGQSAALAAGWRAARAPVVVTLDADLQNDPADVPRLLAALDEGWDVVSGVRVDRQDRWTRRASSRIANAVRNRLTGDTVTDVGCTLRACRAELLRDLPVFAGMHRFLPTLLRLQGARVTEVPVRHRARRFGTTKYGVHDRLWRGIVDLLAVRWLKRRWIDRRAVAEVTPERGGGPGGER